VGWTLNYEMFFYLCFCLALLFTRRTGVVVVAGALAILVAVNQLAPLPNPLGYWAAPIVLEFVFGMLIALAFRDRFRIPRRPAACVVLLAVVALAGSLHWTELPRVIAWGVPSAAIVAALVLGKATASAGPLQRGLSLLGDASYSIYLVHPLAITLPRRLFPQLVSPSAWPWFYAMLLLAITLGAAMLVHILVERPITRSLQRRITSRFRGGERAPRSADFDAIGEQQLKLPIS
jgi:exopolysaccharide production protein ExoZ